MERTLKRRKRQGTSEEKTEGEYSVKRGRQRLWRRLTLRTRQRVSEEKSGGEDRSIKERVGRRMKVRKRRKGDKVKEIKRNEQEGAQVGRVYRCSFYKRRT